MKLCITILGILLLSPGAFAEPAGVGDTLPALELEDQHGEARELDAGVRRLVFTREMKAGRIAKAALGEEAGIALMKRPDTVYVSDVSRMPGLVRALFAMPSLRRRPYPILLDTEGERTQVIPSEAGKVTVLSLDALRVTEVRFLATGEEIRAALAP